MTNTEADGRVENWESTDAQLTGDPATSAWVILGFGSHFLNVGERGGRIFLVSLGKLL